MSGPRAVADRVKESTATTGTGALALDGAATGFQTFNAACGTGVYFDYCIASSGSEWEVGHGYLSGATTLVRETITASSNSGSAVNLSAGTKDVFLTLSAFGQARKTSIGKALLLRNGTFIP